MKILALYPNAQGYSRIPTGMAIIVTVLSRRHEIKVFDTTFMAKGNVDNDIREEALLVKKTTFDYGYEGLSVEQISDRLNTLLYRSRPELMIVTLVEDNYRFANTLMGSAKKAVPGLKILVGGPTPSAVPDIVIENPNVDYLIQGEGEEAVIEFCEGLNESTKNLWTKEFHNPLRPFIDMDTIPFQDFSFWDRRHLIKAYDGKIYRTGYVEASRGCPNRCTYCVNHAIRKSLKSCGNYFRKKSYDKVIAEVEYQMRFDGIERVVFCDDNFLFQRKDFHIFADMWRERVNLPYWITTSVEHITPENLKQLKESGCDGVGFGVEHGDESIRKRVLLRNVSNKKILKTFYMLKNMGIRSTANFMFGWPYETKTDIKKSVEFMKQLDPDSIDVSFVAPYAGTDILRYAQELNLIDTDDAPGFNGMAKEVSFREHAVIYNPNFPGKRKISDYVRH